MENENKKVRDFAVVDMDVYVLRKGNRGFHGRCLRHTQDKEPASVIVRFIPEWGEKIKEGEHYTMSLSISIGECVKNKTPMVSYFVREVKPFVLRPYTCRKCNTSHSCDND